jgi:hypothetical protein
VWYRGRGWSNSFGGRWAVEHLHLVGRGARCVPRMRLLLLRTSDVSDDVTEELSELTPKTSPFFSPLLLSLSSTSSHARCRWPRLVWPRSSPQRPCAVRSPTARAIPLSNRPTSAIHDHNLQSERTISPSYTYRRSRIRRESQSSGPEQTTTQLAQPWHDALVEVSSSLSRWPHERLVSVPSRRREAAAALRATYL